MMKTEYAIWGIPSNSTEETLLLARVNGEFINSQADAEKYKTVLETRHGATKCRIQVLDGTMPNFSAVE